MSRDASNNGTPKTTGSPVTAVTASNNRVANSSKDAINIKTSIVVRNSPTKGPLAKAGMTVQKQGQ